MRGSGIAAKEAGDLFHVPVQLGAGATHAVAIDMRYKRSLSMCNKASVHDDSDKATLLANTESGQSSAHDKYDHHAATNIIASLAATYFFCSTLPPDGVPSRNIQQSCKTHLSNGRREWAASMNRHWASGNAPVRRKRQEPEKLSKHLHFMYQGRVEPSWIVRRALPNILNREMVKHSGHAHTCTQ